LNVDTLIDVEQLHFSRDATGSQDWSYSNFKIDYSERTITNIESQSGTLTDANEAPDVISEGSAVGSEVGITAYGGDGASYRLKDDANGRFAIDASGVVTVANEFYLDYEYAQSHEIVVEATVGETVSEETFTIAVTDNTNEYFDIVELGQNGNEIQFGVYNDPNLDTGEFGYLGHNIWIYYDTSNMSYVSTDDTPYSLPVVNNNATDGIYRFSGSNTDGSPAYIFEEDPFVTFTMAITDIEKPYGFQIGKAVVDETTTSDDLFTYVTNTAFEKTTVVVSGGVSFAQSYDAAVLADAKVIYADQSMSSGLYLRAVDLGATSTFEVVADFDAAVGDLDFTVTTSSGSENYTDQVVGANADKSITTISDVSVGDMITLSGISIDGESVGDVVLTVGESAIGSDGNYSIEIDNGNSVSFGISGLTYDEDALMYPINFMDAIDALKMSVGLLTADAQADGRGNSNLELMVADMTGDGTVNFMDAIQMLRASVGLELDSPNGPSFKAVDNSSFDAAEMDEYTVSAPAITTREALTEDTTVDLTAFLTGDITGIITSDTVL